MKSVEREIVAQYTVFGPVRMGPPAPNGSVPGQKERRAVQYTIFRADYYGHGPKLYMDYMPILVSPNYVHRGLGGQHGDERKIRAKAAAAGVDLD